MLDSKNEKDIINYVVENSHLEAIIKYLHKEFKRSRVYENYF